MARCQRHQLLAPVDEQSIGTDEDRIGGRGDEGSEGGVDLVFAGRREDMELPPPAARRFLRIACLALGALVVGVHQQGDHLGLPNQLRNQIEPLGGQLDDEKTDAGEIATLGLGGGAATSGASAASF